VRAVVFQDVRRVALAEVADPSIEAPGDAVIRITRSAICGSDLHFYRGEPPLEPGDVMGHEAVGVVGSIGDDVRTVVPGDRVSVAFHAACGRCWWCRRGETGLCDDDRTFGTGAFGHGLGGAQAASVRVPAADLNLLRISPGVEDEAAIFVTDTLTTAFHAASLAETGPGETVAVIGCGPVGLLSIQALRALGAEHVVALDTIAARLDLAERFGAIPVNIRERHPESAVGSVTEGRGADVVIEAVGSPPAFEVATEIARRGGRVIVVGMYTGESTEIQLGSYWIRGLAVRFVGVSPVHARWQATMAELEAGRLDPRPLVSHHLPLEEAGRGYELFDRREATKVLLVP
jgi:2-desacetyl-2-hydroxyethyl bacteriochlorophyllide A dehydrogenase